MTEEAQKWSGLGLFSVANTRVVRRSAALMEMNQKSYGNNFIYRTWSLRFKKFSKIASIGLILAF